MLKSIKILVVFTLVIISFGIVNAQNNFEGKVKFKISNDGEDALTMDYFLKDGNFRMEMGEQGKEIIFIHKEKSSFILMPEQKMYMDLDNSLFTKMKEMMGKNVDKMKKENTDKELNIENFKTGETKSILGYKCEQWVFKDNEAGDEDKVEAWVTQELGNFMMMENPMGGGFSPAWSNSIKDKGFFPLLVITKNSEGEESSRFEALEIDKKTIGDDLFAIPSSYSEMKIPGM